MSAPLLPGPPPKVLTWFRVYCGAMAALYVLVFLAGIVVAVMHGQLGGGDEPPPMFFLLYGAFIGMLGLVLGAVFAAAFFLPQRPWVWVYGIVLIALGLSSPCCLPACVPLLIYWVKPDVREYFGRA